MTDREGVRSRETVTCMLCGRPWPLSRSVDVERQRYWVCGPPRRCHQYARTVAAQSIIAPRRPPLWERDRPLHRAVCRYMTGNDYPQS